MMPVTPQPWVALSVLLVCLAITLAIQLFIGRRRFYRTNPAGVEEFRNFRNAVFNLLLEGFLRLVAVLCFLVAFVAFIVVMVIPGRYW